ncbi:Rid family hydrolase [Streptomyces lydicus]|uniref:Rid family hydrolase n=1 Tax=Streptomyces lydicus TaxID=47763 RepID=UPI0036EF75A0
MQGPLAVGPPPRTRSGRGRRPARAALLVAGSTAAIGDVAGQAAKAVENLQTALADAGAELYDVISTRVLVASNRQEDLVTAWEVVRDAFGDHDVPSTLMGVTVLGYHDQLVEIEAVARRPRFLKRRRKRAARAR